MMRGRYSSFLVQRLVFLALGNLILLVAIRLLLKDGASFGDVLRRAGPDVAPIVLAGLGMSGIIFTGSIDLSIAGVIALAGTALGVLVVRGASPIACYAACFGMACGLAMLNGILIRALRIPAIIITLAGLALYRGVALILADLAIPGFSGNISVQSDLYHGPGKFYAGWILLGAILAALAWEAGAKTPRLWLALGSSEEACRLLGLRPGRILQNAFLAEGIFLGLAALVYATRLQAIEPARIARGFELEVIGAVVLGGASIFGGEGSYAGTLLGAFFLYFTLEVLIYAGVSPYFQDLVTGGAILAVIGVDCALNRRRKMIAELA